MIRTLSVLLAASVASAIVGGVAPAQSVTRGPYLQLGTPESVTVRWRTSSATDSRVWYGLALPLSQFVDVPGVVFNHAVTLSGLDPATSYTYAVGSSGGPLAGGDAQHVFVTAPEHGTEQPTRVWVLGDSGTASIDAEAVRDAYLAFNGARHTDLWLMLGDNAYPSGTDAEYQAAVFDMYPDTLRTSVLWSTRGNHEMSASTYYGIFTLPTGGEAGGLPSGSEAYYAFDWANVHFICLDSFGSDRSVGGAMWTWVESDLAANDQDWTIAFWHHPPYSKGTHDSDVETPLVEMRENFLPLLEHGGVDLVLSGHSHGYERSYLLDGHYGDSTTLVPSMVKDTGDGRRTGDGAYGKVLGPHAGAVYCVAGSSGGTSVAPYDHPAMFHSVAVIGSVVLDVDGPHLDVQFLDVAGGIEDSFAIDLQSPFRPFCFGDGLAGPCPCGNEGGVGRGCDNGAATGGVLFSAIGTPANQDVVMKGNGFPPAGAPTVIIVRSAIRTPGSAPFGDGLFCLQPPTTRMLALQVTGGAFSVPLSHGAGPGRFHYQLVYRSSPGVCSPSTFNVSNGLSVDW